MKYCFRFLSIIISLFLSCHHNWQPKQSVAQAENSKTIAQLELKDSDQLTYIAFTFYKSKAGQLFEKTAADRHIPGVDTLMQVEYFNGVIPQDIDPTSFTPLDGWYAKDKRFVYWYRPVSGGMQIVKMDKADVKSFELLKGQYQYAKDKIHVFKDAEILDNIDPHRLKVITNKKGEIIKLISGHNTYVPD